MPIEKRSLVPDDVLERIKQRLEELGITLGPCPICRTTSGYAIGGLVQLPVTDLPPLAPAWLGQPSPYQPLVVFNCQLCGNTVLLNLNTLGLHDLTLTPQELQQEQASLETPTGEAS